MDSCSTMNCCTRVHHCPVSDSSLLYHSALLHVPGQIVQSQSCVPDLVVLPGVLYLPDHLLEDETLPVVIHSPEAKYSANIVQYSLVK